MSVLVIGAGRSGTSALAGALEALGLSVGPQADLVPSSQQNPSGFFELRAVAELNEELLIHFGGAWDCPPALPENWFTDPGMADFIGRAQELLKASFGQNPFVLKDPRIALLLPFWRRVLLDRCCAVMVVRDPTAVAWSLSLSFGWSGISSLVLWSTYNRSAIDGLSGLPVHICSYEELVETPVETLTAITESLRLWDEVPKDSDFDAAVARINPGLRRDTWPRNQTDFVTPPPEFARLASALMEKRGRHDSFDPGNLPDPGPWHPALLEERRTGRLQQRASRDLIDALAAECATLRADCEALQANGDGLRMDNERLRTQAQQLESQVAVARTELASMEDEVDGVRDDLDRLLQSRTFRYTATLRNLYAAFRREVGLG